VVRVIWHKAASPQEMDGLVVLTRLRQRGLPWGGTLALPGEYSWNCASFSPPKFTTQTTNRLVQPFLHSSCQKVLSLYFTTGTPSPPNLPLPMRWSEPPSHTWFLRPIRILSQNGISISIAFLHSSLHSVPILYNGLLFPPSKLPLPMTGCWHPLIHGSLSPPESTQTASW